MQYSPLLNESQSDVWSALNDPYHAPTHLVDDEEGSEAGKRKKQRRSRTD